MFHAKFQASNTADFYEKLQHNALFLFNMEPDWLANLSNASALIGINMERINWAGFYLWRKDALLLGPFWGNPACTRIELNKGVCGTAIAQMQPQIVDDVSAFPGHIPCDAQSQSEMVIPFVAANGRLLGVLDIDSPELARFSKEDLCGMKRFLDILVKATDWPEVF